MAHNFIRLGRPIRQEVQPAADDNRSLARHHGPSFVWVRLLK
jgi:hypothetical protein